jgi:hypothetical protein
MKAFLFFAIALAGCTRSAVDSSTAATAPLLAATDAGDRADRVCQVVLRDYAAGFGDLDVATALSAASATVLFRAAGSAAWLEAPSVAVVGAASDFQRWRFRLPDPISDGATDVELAPFARLDDGARVFDHNRHANDFVNDRLDASNGFRVVEDSNLCPSTVPRATLEFKNGYTEEQHGALTAGGRVTVDYALARLPQCRTSSGGAQRWDIEAFVKWQPSGQLVEVSVTTVAGGERVARPPELAIPLDAQYADVWFHNFDAERHCEAWDSAFGQNYRFPVLNAPLSGSVPPAPVAWAGDWGNGFWRGCTHRDGLDEPVVIDEYIRERACTFVDADVYVPGVTDGNDVLPWKVEAQVELSRDGASPTYAWLTFEGRVGNNYRYRFGLPDDWRYVPWNRFAYAFRFSTDGNRWFRIAQDAGPDGGAARTIQKGFQ